LGSSFRGQLYKPLGGAALREPFWGVDLKNRSFGAIALDSSFVEQLWGAASGNSFGEQLWGTFENSFEEHFLCRTAAFGHTFTRNFGE